MKKLLVVGCWLLAGGMAQAKAPLLPLYCYRFTQIDQYGGIEAVNCNTGTGTIPLTKKLWGSEKTVPATYGDSGPLRGKFGTYSIQENAWSSYWLEGTSSGGLGCGAVTGFAISLWFRPTSATAQWTDFFGFRLGGVDYNFEYNAGAPNPTIQVYSGSEPKQHFRARHNANGHVSGAAKVGEWNHLCVVWKPYVSWRAWPKNYGEIWLNGQKAGMFISANDDDGNGSILLNTLYLGAWQLRGGNDRGTSAHTGIGEIAVYGCAISDDDVAYLHTHAPGPLPRGREMTVGLHFDRSYHGSGGWPATIANSGTFQTPITLRGSTVDLTCEGTGAAGSQYGIRLKGQNGKWIVGDAETGLGASIKTGMTFSYWSRPNKDVISWSDIFSIGFDDGENFRHEYHNQSGNYGFYGDCSQVQTWESLDTWHHHALVLEPGAKSFQHWADGKNVGTLSFNSTVTDGLLRRLCIGPTVMNENGGDRCQGGSCNAGLDEVAVYNYAMSDAEIAWLTTHEVALPPLAVTALARTVSADGAWAGTAADWTLNGTSRKIVWPAGEDAGAAATLTVAGEVAVTVDTLVHVTNLVFAGEGALALSVAPNCRLASPEELTVGKGLAVTLPAGMALSGTVRGAGALAGAGSFAGTWKIDALDGADAGWLSWPADTDFSSTTIDVAVEKGRLAEYTLVKGFTGKLPKKVLHQGEEDGVFVVSVIGGDLVLRNKDKCGMRIFVR